MDAATLARSFARAALDVGRRRLLHGPLLPTWSLRYELVAHVTQREFLALSRLEPRARRARMEQTPIVSDALELVRREPAEVGGVPGVVVTPKSGATDGVLLYLHGGGFELCSTRTHRDLIARLCLASRTRVVAVDYRLAPEHKFPAAVDDCFAAYRHVLGEAGSGARVVVAGDSAGGCLTLDVMLRARAEGLDLPAAGVLLSPVTDARMPGRSIRDNQRFDYVVQAIVDQWLPGYVGSASPDDPLVSPVRADLAGLPPLYVLAGGAEVLLDPIAAFVARAKDQDVDVTYEVYPDMIHVFPIFASMLPECRPAIERMGAFIRDRLRGR